MEDRRYPKVPAQVAMTKGNQVAKKSTFKRITKSVTVLHLDSKNPRLGRRRQSMSQQEIIQYLFEHDKAYDVAESIALLEYYPTEFLLAVVEHGKYVVVEGNRRLAALKGLHNPDLLEPPLRSKLQELRNRMNDPGILSAVPIVVAANRRATDKTVTGRHRGQAIKQWQAGDRAAFITEKLEEGYTVDELRDELNFSSSHIQKAKQTKAIRDISQSLPIVEEKAKLALSAERPAIYSTVDRVFDSSFARSKLFIEPDLEEGFVMRTSKPEVQKAMVKLITDIASGNETSRTLNNEEAIKEYFTKRWKTAELPAK